jgi:hypothetical protein
MSVQYNSIWPNCQVPDLKLQTGPDFSAFPEKTTAVRLLKKLYKCPPPLAGEDGTQEAADPKIHESARAILNGEISRCVAQAQHGGIAG